MLKILSSRNDEVQLIITQVQYSSSKPASNMVMCLNGWQLASSSSSNMLYIHNQQVWKKMKKQTNLAL